MGLLDDETLDLILDVIDLALQLAAIIASNRAGNNRSAHTTSPPKSSLAGDKHIRDILILTEQRQVQDDLEGLGVGGHHDELGDAAIQGLGGLVGTLAELLVVTGLLDQIQDRVGEAGVGEGGGFFVALQKTKAALSHSWLCYKHHPSEREMGEHHR